MARISVYLKDDQQEWVERVARKLDESEAEVIRRVIDAQREERNALEDPSADSGPTTGAREDAGDADGPSHDELVERISELEEQLAAEREQSDDETMGWR